MRINVLLVEDDDDFAKIVGRWLEKSPKVTFEVTKAASLEQALFNQGAPEYDVILADLNLPDSADYETISHLRARNPRLPIVALSATDAEETMYRSVCCGAEDYIAKSDCDPHKLVSSILSSIARRFEMA